jgi:glycosyltransferase involved in cell wall biosynthesis
MKICLVHNGYRHRGGEDLAVRTTSDLLTEAGHEVIPFLRDSGGIREARFGAAKAFFSGIYSRSSRREMGSVLARERPDVVHIHNVFPLISPSVLRECGKHRVPVVMTVHNYRLVCPNGLLFRAGHLCELCLGGREYLCFLTNCERNPLRSLGYALRNYVSRRGRFFLDNVTVYHCLTDFQRRTLVAQGFPEDRMVVVPNMARSGGPGESARPGGYVGYVGRLTPEKGISTLLEAARMCPGIPFRIAGDYTAARNLPEEAPENVAFIGPVPPAGVGAFYAASRFLVVSSICFEGFPLTIAEGMAHGKAVVCSRIGGLPEIVQDGTTGLLFGPGNPEDLAEKVRYLWAREDVAFRMGQAGKEQAARRYSPEAYGRGILAAYDLAVRIRSVPPGEKVSQ